MALALPPHVQKLAEEGSVKLFGKWESQELVWPVRSLHGSRQLTRVVVSTSRISPSRTTLMSTTPFTSVGTIVLSGTSLK